MNNPWTLSHPFRWQPTLRTDGFGLFCRSEHLTPYAGSAIAFTLSPSDIASRKVKSPYRRGNVIAKNVLQRDLKVLKRAAKGVFRTSATLTERERVLAEFFDNKLSAFHTSEKPMGELGIASLLRFVIIGPTLDYSLDEEIVRGLEAIMATFDSLVLAWKEKRRIDAVRPTGQTMEFLFGNQKFEIWGGPGRPNEKIRAGLWKPLIGIMPHSEFPSATACLCTALIEHASILLKGRQFFSYNITVPKGASRFYPGMMPEQDVVIPVNSLSEFNYLCGQSRLWAGVHFKDAVDAGRSLCKGLGRSAHGVGERLLAGKKDDTWIKWLSNDVDRFWERE